MRHWREILAGGLCLLLAGCRGPAVSPESEGPDSNRYTPPYPVTDALLPVEACSDPREETISHVVIHSMSAVRDHPEAPCDMTHIRRIFLDGGVSTHYVVDRQGTVYRLIPEERIAWHAGKGKWLEERFTDRLNAYSIGIELLGMGTAEEMETILTPDQYAALAPTLAGFTDELYAALRGLLRDIERRHPAVLFNREHILGHGDYSPSKTDPGELFDWSRLELPDKPGRPQAEERKESS